MGFAVRFRTASAGRALQVHALGLGVGVWRNLEHFEETWRLFWGNLGILLQSIRCHVGETWKSCLGNLKIVLERIGDHFEDNWVWCLACDRTFPGLITREKQQQRPSQQPR